MADNYIDKFSDPEFQKDFGSMSKEDQDSVLKAIGVSRASATLAPIMRPPYQAKKADNQSMAGPLGQPQRQEPNTLDQAMPYYKPAMGAMVVAGAPALGPLATGVAESPLGQFMKSAASRGGLQKSIEALKAQNLPVSNAPKLKELEDMLSKTPDAKKVIKPLIGGGLAGAGTAELMKYLGLLK